MIRLTMPNHILIVPKPGKGALRKLSISAERHKSFEKNVNAKNSHKLDLEMYLPSEIKNNQVKSNEVLTQLKKLNDLYKEGVLTKEEFEKAKKKILD